MVRIGAFGCRSGLVAAASLLSAAACGNPIGPSHELSGLYTFRVETGCSALPADIRSRTFLARIDGTTVTLSGATFWTHPTLGLKNKFPITINGDKVGLVLDQPPGFGAKGFVEETAPGRYFNVSGAGLGTTSEFRTGGFQITGTLVAGFGWGSDLARDEGHVGCPQGTGGTFVFTPATGAFPAPGVALSLLRIEIAGPISMEPKETAQFRALGHFTDGSSSDVTPQTAWTALPSPALEITSGGMAVALAFGEAPVTAAVLIPNMASGLRVTQEVVVVPPNTFRIAGQVVTGSPAQAVVDADVTVLSGAGAGRSTRTDWEGKYRLYGITGPTEIRIAKAGYPSQLRSVDAQSHTTLDVTLPSAVVQDISGTYTLTMRADLSCRDPVDADRSARTYTAAILQTGRQLLVRLGGASFVVDDNLHGDRFPGTVDPERAMFQLDDNDYWGHGGLPDVIEVLPDRRVLMFFGTITVDIAPNRLAGYLDGSFTPATLAPVAGFFWGENCQSSRHEVVFSR